MMKNNLAFTALPRAMACSALLLVSALVSIPAMAAVVTNSSVDCGTQGQDSGTYGGVDCINTGTKFYGNDSGDTYDYKIQASAAASYVLGGLRTNGKITFEGLQEGRAGATSTYPAGTFALAQYQDWFRFVFPNAEPGSALTMKTTVRFHGTHNEYVDESVFYDGNQAQMRSELTVLGLGIPEVRQMASFLTVSNKQVTALGSSDITNIFTKSFTLDANSAHNAYVTMTLSTATQLINNFYGSLGVGDGILDSDFSHTAGVLSIDFFDSQGQSIEYQLTTDTGEFAFLAPPSAVPVPAAAWLFASGLIGLVGFARRKKA